MFIRAAVPRWLHGRLDAASKAELGDAKEITLQTTDPEFPQHRRLLCGFDPFGDSEHIKLMRHVDQRLCQHLIIRRVRQVTK